MILKDGNILGNDTISNLKEQFVNEENESLEDIFLELTKDV